MNPQFVHWVDPTTLKANPIASDIFSIPENYETIKENIKQIGILEPLTVYENLVISGNIRLKIALELGLKSIPVLYTDDENATQELRIVSHGQQRIKKYSEILRECEILEKAYPVGRGCRTDKNPIKKKHKELLENSEISKSMLAKLKSIRSLSTELYGIDSEEFNALWENVDSGVIKPSSALKKLKSKFAVQKNQSRVPKTLNIDTEELKVYHKSCKEMTELSDKSVACIFTSPAYYGMRDYGTGDKQRGMEQSIEEYVEGLVSDFSDCMRILKDDGSFWVNINEPVRDGKYHIICHQFVLAMLKQGWILNDEWIWTKNNPQFTQAKRAVRSHEYIFHFVKSSDFYYDKTWLDDLIDDNNQVSIGTKGEIANLISGMDIYGTIIRTNGNNMSALRNKCKENGFVLTHTAGFPLSLPAISILTTSRPEDIVVDTCNGTGTTGQCALMLDRKYVGYEIKSEFILATQVRIDEMKNQFKNEEITQAA